MRWASCYRGFRPELDGIAGSPAAPAVDPGLPGCPSSARLVWFRPDLPGCPCCPPGCPTAVARPAAVDLGEVMFAADSSSPFPAPPRPVRCSCCPPGRPPSDRPPSGPPPSILERWCLPRTAADHPWRRPDPPGCPCCPPGRPSGRRPSGRRPSGRPPACRRRSWRGGVCRGQQLTISGAAPRRPVLLLSAWPAVRPPSGPPASILLRWCLLRTAVHQPRRRPDPPGCPCCPPGRPSGRGPACRRRSW